MSKSKQTREKLQTFGVDNNVRTLFKLLCFLRHSHWQPFFLPWNQVDLILKKSGQPFLGALVFQIRAILKNQGDPQKQLKVN